MPGKRVSPYGRGWKVMPSGRPWHGETYYRQPSVKPSLWGWKVSGYIALAGLSGAAQVIAMLAARLGSDQAARRIARTGRYLGLVGPVVGSPLLIADLHTPQRWYNMLRIFRPSSPMSIGSYLLAAFGAANGVAAAAQAIDDAGGAAVEGIARLADIPAATAGAGMAIYTGSVLASTSTPLWAATPCSLPALFGCSAMASAASAISLAEQAAGDDASAARLDRLALAAATVELGVQMLADHSWRLAGVAVMDEPETGRRQRRAALVGQVLPIACHALNLASGRRFPALSVLGCMAALAGSFLLRSSIMEAGNRSAERPQDYFRLTQPPFLQTPQVPTHDSPRQQLAG